MHEPWAEYSVHSSLSRSRARQCSLAAGLWARARVGGAVRIPATESSSLLPASSALGLGVFGTLVLCLACSRGDEGGHRSRRASPAAAASLRDPAPPGSAEMSGDVSHRPAGPAPPDHELRTLPAGLRPITGASLLEHVRRRGARGMVVNVWASWCAPCRRELPTLIQMDRSYPELQLMLVSADHPDDWQRAAEVLRELGAPRPSYVILEPLERFKPALSARWPGMIPATFLFDARAQLRYFWGGPVFDHELLPLLDRYLAGETIDGESVVGLAPGKQLR